MGVKVKICGISNAADARAAEAAGADFVGAYFRAVEPARCDACGGGENSGLPLGKR